MKPSHVARRLVQWWPCLPTRRRSWRRWKWPPMGFGGRSVGWGRVSLSTWMWLNECLFYMLSYVFWMCWMMVEGWGRVWMKVVRVCEEVQSIESIEQLWTQHILFDSHQRAVTISFTYKYIVEIPSILPWKTKTLTPNKMNPDPERARNVPTTNINTINIRKHH